MTRAWKAHVLPLHHARVSPDHRARQLKRWWRRSSVGTSPSSSTSDGGGHGPNQLSRAPSSVITEPDSARPSGEAASATSQACSCSRPSRCSGHRARGALPDGLGVLAQRRRCRSGRRRARARRCRRRPTRARARACSPRPRRGRRSSGSCRSGRGAGESVTLTIVPPPAGRIASSAASRVIRSVPPTLSPVTARQPFGSIASAGTKYWPPALLTRTSSRPWRSRHVAHDPLGVLVAADVAGHDARARADPLARLGEHVLLCGRR